MSPMLLGTTHLDVDCVGDLDLVVHDGVHQWAVVLHNRALSGVHRRALRPSKSKSHRQVAKLGGVISRARILRNVESGDADVATLAHDGHAVVEDLGGHLLPVDGAARLEAHTVDGRVNGGEARDGGELVAQRAVGPNIDGLTPKRARLRMPPKGKVQTHGGRVILWIGVCNKL
eukprot:6190837-Pleurochrysis_carterae.AAC.1